MRNRNTLNFAYPMHENSLFISILRWMIALTLALFMLLFGISLANADAKSQQASVRIPSDDAATGIIRVVQCQHGKISKKINGKTAPDLLVIGNIGMLMDGADRVCVKNVLDHVSDGLTAVWVNRTSKVRYLLTPLHSARTKANALCRVYTAKAFAKGSVLETYQKACRLADGSWSVHWGETFN